MRRGHVAVVGGGLAGITAALRCADAGFGVTVLEARPRLGGATCSFRRGDLTVDNGQHVFLRCYGDYTDLLRRMGVLGGVSVQSRFHAPIVVPYGQSFALRRCQLPAPAHLAPVLTGHRALTVRQRARVVRTVMALRQLNPENPELDRMSFGDWLDAQRESRRSVQVLWGLVSVAALNADPYQSSLALAAKVFQKGMLDTADGGDIGMPQRPLGELHGTAAQHALTGSGAVVRLQSKVRAIRRNPNGLQMIVHNGGSDAQLEADAVVVAVPHQAASTLLSEHLPEQSRRWSGLSASPIVNVHVVYDRQVTDLPMAAVIDSPVQWVFDRTTVAGASRGQYLAVSLSAADAYINARTEDLRQRFLPALQEAFPRARHARVLDFFVTREPRATFLQAPGTRALRPSASTGIPGLVLAGAWTDTGWPDTIESAVASGIRAAEVVDRTCSDRGVEVTA